MNYLTPASDFFSQPSAPVPLCEQLGFQAIPYTMGVYNHDPDKIVVKAAEYPAQILNPGSMYPDSTYLYTVGKHKFAAPLYLASFKYLTWYMGNVFYFRWMAFPAGARSHLFAEFTELYTVLTIWGSFIISDSTLKRGQENLISGRPVFFDKHPFSLKFASDAFHVRFGNEAHHGSPAVDLQVFQMSEITRADAPSFKEQLNDMELAQAEFVFNDSSNRAKLIGTAEDVDF